MAEDSASLYQLKNTEQKILEIELAEQYIKEVLVAISGLAIDAESVDGVYQEIDKVVTVADNEIEIDKVYEDLIKGLGTNLPSDSSILNALTNAGDASTSAGESSGYADSSSGFADDSSAYADASQKYAFGDPLGSGTTTKGAQQYAKDSSEYALASSGSASDSSGFASSSSGYAANASGYADNASNSADAAANAAASIQNASVVSPVTSVPNTPQGDAGVPTVDFNNSTSAFTFGIPVGAKGETGDQGLMMNFLGTATVAEINAIGSEPANADGYYMEDAGTITYGDNDIDVIVDDIIMWGEDNSFTNMGSIGVSSAWAQTAGVTVAGNVPLAGDDLAEAGHSHAFNEATGVPANIVNAIDSTGDTMTGQLSGMAPISDANLTRKDYVDGEISAIIPSDIGALALDGGVLSGDLYLNEDVNLKGWLSGLARNIVEMNTSIGKLLFGASNTPLQIEANGLAINSDTTINGDLEVTGAITSGNIGKGALWHTEVNTSISEGPESLSFEVIDYDDLGFFMNYDYRFKMPAGVSEVIVSCGIVVSAASSPAVLNVRLVRGGGDFYAMETPSFGFPTATCTSTEVDQFNGIYLSTLPVSVVEGEDIFIYAWAKDYATVVENSWFKIEVTG